jgi:5-methylcytosine-specific restriction endonuclease McrA
MNRATLKLEEYQCQKCGRLFYLDRAERHPLDLDFGYPYSCDGNGRHVQGIRTDVTGVARGGEGK